MNINKNDNKHPTKNDKKSKTHHILPGFPDARSALKEKYDSASNIEADSIFSLLVGNTIRYELFSENKPDSAFSVRVQQFVIDHIVGASTEEVDEWINNRTDFDKISTPISDLEKFIGAYTYWRFFPEDENSTILKLRAGDIRIYKESGGLRFRHRSANAASNIEWEDEGFVKVFGSRMYMIGFRNENIRLSICHIPVNLATKHLHGIVLSTQTANGKIFAASFALFHESHPDFHAERDNMDAYTRKFENFGLAQPWLSQRIMLD